MAGTPHNDGDDTSSSGPDAHAHAAILLVESLIHGLIARSVISTADAAEIVSVAVDVIDEFAVGDGSTPTTVQQSKALLETISTSLSYDADNDGLSPRIV